MLPPKVRGKCFKIGGAPWIEVSWQITGVRQHRSAQANPLVVTAKEPKRARLLYLSRALRLAWGTRVFGGIAAHSSCLSLRGTKRAGGCESRSERGYPLRPIFCYRWFRTDENAPSIEVIQLLSRFESLHDSTANCRHPPSQVIGEPNRERRRASALVQIAFSPSACDRGFGLSRRLVFAGAR